MTKGQRYLGNDKDGNPIIEFYNVVEEQSSQEIIDYDSKVTELIREKYSLNDELSLNSKSMSIFLNTCTQEEKIRWTEQLKEFTAYRVECIRRAKEMCNMI